MAGGEELIVVDAKPLPGAINNNNNNSNQFV